LMREPWTVLALLNEASRYLSQKAVSTPRLDAEVLLAHALGWRRIDLYLRHDQPLAPAELERFRELLRRRGRREPVAYITGTKEFWSLPLSVTPKVLVPRPETELLVEVALRSVRSRKGRGAGTARVLEIGTGSGAVAIAVGKEAGGQVRLVATDLSRDALSVAKANARRFQVEDRISFVQGDLFDALRPDAARFFMIISNPPYVPTDEIPGLPPDVREYEPLHALDGGPGGLEVIGRIVDQAPTWLEEGGILLLEVGEGQRPAVDARLEGGGCWRDWQWHRDLSGRERVLHAIKG
jgi:release factor glutamine methyltransferase